MQFEINYPPAPPPRYPTFADMKDGDWGVVKEGICRGWLVRCTIEDDDGQQGWHCFGPNGRHRVFRLLNSIAVDILPKGTTITLTL